MNELHIPGTIYKPQCPAAGHYWLNAGLCEYNGQTVMAYRVDRFPCSVVLSEVDDRYQPQNARWLFELGQPGITPVVPEDPRLFVHDDRLAIVYAGVERPWSTIWYAEYDAQYEMRHKEQATYGGRLEKNWTPFTRDNDLFFVYNHDPFTVIQRRGDGQWRLKYCQDVVWGWDWGEMRGGTPAIWHDGLYYHFFHSSGCVGLTKVYFVGVYTFDRDFRPVSITRLPIMSGHGDHYTQPWGGGPISAVFPCGAVFRDDKWAISYGYLDSEVRVVEFDHDTIEKTLVKIG